MSGLVLLHGFTGDPSSWDGVAALFPSETIVFRETLLGHEPASQSVASVSSFAGEVDRIAASLRARSLRDLHLCGYSLGGRIALGLLARHPDLFRRATIVSAQAALATDEERAAREASDERWARLLEKKGIADFVRAWEAQPLFATQARLPEAIRNAVRARRLAKSPIGLAHSLRVLGVAKMPDLTASLAQVEIPVTLVAGEEDSKFCAAAKSLARQFVHCSMRVVPGAGHDVILERPDAIAAALKEAP